MNKALTEEELNNLYRYALSLTAQDEQAYDLVHDALINSRGRLILNYKSYLKRSIRNQFYDLIKSRRRDVEIDDVTSGIDSGFENIILDQNELEYCLNKLSAQERELLFLVYFEGRSYKDVAKYLKVKKGTVMSRLSRCKEKIKKEMRVYD